MHAEIYGRFEHLGDTDAGREAVAVYIDAIERGECEAEAEGVANNVLQRAGYNVNAHGGASYRVASIDHNEVDGARVSLKIDRDERGHFVTTADDEDTEMRFPTAADAYDAITQRWGSGWNLSLAG